MTPSTPSPRPTSRTVRRILTLLMVASVMAFGLLAFASPGTAHAGVSYNAEEIAFYELINDYRVSQGVAPLKVSDLLSESADRHNSDMAKYHFFDHYTHRSDWFPWDSSPFYRMGVSGYTYNTYKGENIAAGYDSALEVFTGWKSSSGHRSNMLNENFKVIGISRVYDGDSTYGSYWTTDFGGYVDSTAHVLPYVEPTIPYRNIRGSDRYDTALLISQATFPNALPNDSGLVLAPGSTFPEALCGAPLAAAYGGPVLLTPTAGLANNVAAEIDRLAPDYVICIGLSDTIVTAVQNVLGAGGTATAIRGATVYDMSRRVAMALAARVGGLGNATAIVTRGDNFPDAISVAPLACLKEWPILLTGPTGPLHESSVQALADLGITKAIKVGTYAALPDEVQGLINLSGSDRYQTNRNVAVWSRDQAGSTCSHLGLATGDKFPDALAAGPYLAADHGILLLSPLDGPLPVCIGGFLTENRSDIDQFSFIAMIEPVLSETKALLP